jgi:hypothetical protein
MRRFYGMKMKHVLMGTAAVCVFAWCFHSNDIMAGDSVVIKDLAFEELSELNDALRSVPPGYLDDIDSYGTTPWCALGKAALVKEGDELYPAFIRHRGGVRAIHKGSCCHGVHAQAD